MTGKRLDELSLGNEKLPTAGQPLANLPRSGGSGRFRRRNQTKPRPTAAVEEHQRDPNDATQEQTPEERCAWRPPAHVELPAQLGGLLLSRGFLRSYVEYAFPLSEAPAEAHLAGAFVTASGLVGRKVTISPWGDDVLHLNVWANICGSSTLSRKTTTLRKGESVVRTTEAALILPDDTTAPALIDQLAQRNERVWFLSELSSLFAQCEARWNVGMKQLIASLYDVPPELVSARMRKEPQSQVTRVTRPYVAILGATTPAWLNAHLNETDLLGGLYARFLHFSIPESTVDGRCISIPPKVDQARRKKVLDQAKALYTYTGRIDLARIRERYDTWYIQHRKEPYTLNDRERLGPFWGRFETYCLKIAALQQLSLVVDQIGSAPPTPQPQGRQQSGRVLAIEPEALEAAIALIELLKKELVRLFEQELGLTKLEEFQQKMLGKVRRRGGSVSRRDLQRDGGMRPAVFREVLASLTQDGRLKEESKHLH